MHRDLGLAWLLHSRFLAWQRRNDAGGRRSEFGNQLLEISNVFTDLADRALDFSEFILTQPERITLGLHQDLKAGLRGGQAPGFGTQIVAFLPNSVDNGDKLAELAGETGRAVLQVRERAREQHRRADHGERILSARDHDRRRITAHALDRGQQAGDGPVLAPERCAQFLFAYLKAAEPPLDGGHLGLGLLDQFTATDELLVEFAALLGEGRDFSLDLTGSSPVRLQQSLVFLKSLAGRRGIDVLRFNVLGRCWDRNEPKEGRHQPASRPAEQPHRNRTLANRKAHRPNFSPALPHWNGTFDPDH